ncbi:MAG: SCO family protein [Verrucomicrobia bacterium]|nr:SCO family protein [Verrucomicrobiota bacterium]
MTSDAKTVNEPATRGDEKLFLGIVIALAVIAGIGSWLAVIAFSHREKLQGMAPDHSRYLQDFSFTDSAGRNITRRDVDGKLLAVSFLFTSCSQTCPQVTHSMAEIQRLTTNAPDVRLLSFTVDPRSDTPPVLAKWGTRFGADTNRWYLLTGDQGQLLDLIGTSFLAAETNNPFNSMPGNFGGTERIAVVDKQGRVRVFFDGLRLETPAAVVAEIARLRAE